MPRATLLNLTLFSCPCGAPLALVLLPSVTRPITLTCPTCHVVTRIGPDRPRVDDGTAVRDHRRIVEA